MTTEKHESIIEKIKKLFAMAQRTTNNDGTSNEAEATAAMARAQELLTKYNLDLKTVEDAKAAAGQQPSSTGKREQQQVKHSAMYRWQVRLWAAIAEANYCFHWVAPTIKMYAGRTMHVKRHVVLGSEANVAAVLVMGAYLCETIERLLPFPAAQCHSREASSWREGCADRLAERVREKFERMRSEGVANGTTQCTALAVQDLHEKEYAANYDARYGAGAYARMKKRQAEWDVEMAARRKQRDEERARVLAGETPEQRTKREKAEARAAAKQQAADARYWDRQFRREQRHAARRDMASYARGYKKANDVNLDSQIKPGKDKGSLA